MLFVYSSVWRTRARKEHTHARQSSRSTSYASLKIQLKSGLSGAGGFKNKPLPNAPDNPNERENKMYIPDLILKISEEKFMQAANELLDMIYDEIDDTETLLLMNTSIGAMINHYSLLNITREIERKNNDTNRDVHNR